MRGEGAQRCRRARWSRSAWSRLVLALAVVGTAACAEARPVAEPIGPPTTPSSPSTASTDTRVSEGDSAVSTGGVSAALADIVVDVDKERTPIDPRLFGSNVPAWLGAERLSAPWFREAIADAGITVLRMPGGSWSNEYGWAACERQLETGCIGPAAARPSDYIELLNATGTEGMWTVSINETAQSAAATVAFFNGELDDMRPIGIDRNGVDWGIVADWAFVRAAGGHQEPSRIELWEIGNEVYGGRPETGGDECADFGWEPVWTCDGTAYVLGDDEHDGYLAIREAMLAVDPTIEIGAVGVPKADEWRSWGEEVIELVAEAMDFYIIHQYAFDRSPAAEAVGPRAVELWPSMVASVYETLPLDVPVAVTEYNLVSAQAGDTGRVMTTAVNALYLADAIGQMAIAGIEMANQWNVANGTTESGTDYGLIAADGAVRFPQFTGMAVWAGTGPELVRVRYPAGIPGVNMYATAHEDGALSLIVVHHGADTRSVTIGLAGEAGADAQVHGWAAAASDSLSMAEQDEYVVDIDAGAFTLELPAWSITRIDVSPPT